MRPSFHKTFLRCISLWLLFTVLVSCSNDLRPQPRSSGETKSPGRTEADLPKQQSSDLAHTETPRVTPSFIPEPTSTQSTNESIWIRRYYWTSVNQIRTMLMDQSGNLWAGGPGGIVSWDLSTGQHSIYVVETRPDTSDVVALAQTSDSGIWIGTFGNGITRIDPIKQWQTFTARNGLPSNYIATLLPGPDGIIWVDTSPYAAEQMNPGRGYLGQFDGVNWAPGIGGGFFRIVASHNGDLWAIVRMQVGQHWESYISVFRGEKWEKVNIGQKTSSITAITVAPDGKVWVAAKTGIFLNDGNNWKRINPPWNDTIVANVSSIEVSMDGTAWVGFSVGVGIFGDGCGDRMINTEEIGVYRYDGQRWTHFTDKNGLLDNKVCDITLDQDIGVLFGTFDKGISLYDGNRWTSFVVKD